MTLYKVHSTSPQELSAILLARCAAPNKQGCILYPKTLPLSIWYAPEKQPARIQRIVWQGVNMLPRGQAICSTCCNPRCLAIDHLQSEYRSPRSDLKGVARKPFVHGIPKLKQLTIEQEGVLLDAMDVLFNRAEAAKQVTGPYPSHPDYSAQTRKLTGLTIKKTTRKHLKDIEDYCNLERACHAYLAANT